MAPTPDRCTVSPLQHLQEQQCTASMPDYVNVLPLLEQASSSLRHNELIQSQHISLFETTSAIEIGEPRMDTGVYTEEEKAFPNLDVFKPLMPSELLWVMDSMLSLEVSKLCLRLGVASESIRTHVSLQMKWFQGYALAQTIFTCRYVHELDKLDLEDVYMRRAQDNDYPVPLMTVVLRAFIRGTLKTCDMAMEEMYKRHVYDVSQPWGIRFHSKYGNGIAHVRLFHRTKTSLAIRAA